MGIEEQINEMLDGLETKPEQKEEPSEAAAPAEEEGKIDEPKEEPSKEETASEKVAGEAAEQPVEREPIKEAPEEKVEQPIAAEDARIAALQATINQLSQQLLQAGVAPPQPQAPEQPKPAAPPVAAQPQPSVDVDLSKFQILPEGVDFEDVVNDKASFEKFFRDLLVRFNTVRVRQDALAIPMMVSRQVQSLNTLNDAVRTFYDTNKDLVAVKPLVGAFCNRIVAEHPDWNLPQVLDEAAKQSRAAIGAGVQATQPAATQQPVKPVRPSFATTSATRNVAPKGHETKLAKDVADLIADL